jgi:hypothetical protein
VAGKVGGEPIQFITVGGRTTAFVPKRQKKTAAAEPKKRGADKDTAAKPPAAKKVATKKAPAKKAPPKRPMAVAAAASLRVLRVLRTRV